MKYNYIFTIAIMILIALGGYYWLNQNNNNTPDETTFVVGTVANYAPWVSTNANGEYEGFDVDVMHALAKQMNKKLVIKDLGSMSSLLIALEQKKIDAIIWGMSITQERLKKIAMVHYQGKPTTAYQLLFWQTIPSGIRSVEDMAGKTVCVEPASAQDMVLSSYPAIIKLPTEKIDDALLQIQYGKAAAAFVEPAIAKKFKKRFAEIQILDVPLTPEQQALGVGICIQKNNEPLIRAVTDAVNTLRENGTITKLETQWDIA